MTTKYPALGDKSSKNTANSTLSGTKDILLYHIAYQVWARANCHGSISSNRSTLMPSPFRTHESTLQTRPPCEQGDAGRFSVSHEPLNPVEDPAGRGTSEPVKGYGFSAINLFLAQGLEPCMHANPPHQALLCRWLAIVASAAETATAPMHPN